MADELRAEVVHLEVNFGDHRGRAVRVIGGDWRAPAFPCKIEVSILVDPLGLETVDALAALVTGQLKAMLDQE